MPREIVPINASRNIRPATDERTEYGHHDPPKGGGIREPETLPSRTSGEPTVEVVLVGAKYCSTAEAIPFATTSWLPVLMEMVPSKGSVRKNGSMTAPGIWLGVEK